MTKKQQSFFLPSFSLSTWLFLQPGRLSKGIPFIGTILFEMNQAFKIITVTTFFTFGIYSLFAQRFEAENATLAGGAKIISGSSASGGYYVAQEEGNLTFNITLENEALYNIYIHAASPHGDKINTFSTDGQQVDFSLSQNSKFISLKVVSNYKLSEGEHTALISKSWGWINIDYIEFEVADASERFNINKTLVTPEPSENTAKLYQFLLNNYGEKIISGAMTLNSMDEINWLKANTGKEPALIGLDFMHSGQNYNWYNDEEPINDAKNYYNRNGIPAICWHWRDPLNNTEAFYTNDTDFDVSKILDENSPEYVAMIKDIDFISGLLKKLQDTDVPVLWRPLHEASGGWFWWGAKGPEPCKRLWQTMYERMVNYHGLKNLIWIWTSQQNDSDWYPGDDVVDMIGRDIYKEGDHSSQILEFNQLNDMFGGKKMIALSETGSFPDADNLVKDEAPWSFYMPWYGDFVRNSKYNSLDLWKKMFAHDYVLTLDEMPDLRTYVTPDVTGISFEKANTGMQVFPTRVSTQLNIQSREPSLDITVLSSLGIPIKNYCFSSSHAVISFSNFEPGIYLIKINTFKAVKIVKI